MQKHATGVSADDFTVTLTWDDLNRVVSVAGVLLDLPERNPDLWAVDIETVKRVRAALTTTLADFTAPTHTGWVKSLLHSATAKAEEAAA